MSDQPKYESVQMSRHQGRGVTVDTAPQRSLISVRAVLDRLPWVVLDFIEPDCLNIADQVLYRITGYDSETACLILELVEDWRPQNAEAARADA